MIAGVAGGLGRYLGIDPVVIRVILIVLVFFGGAGVIAYLAAWLLVPSDKDGSAGDSNAVARRAGIALGAIVLAIIAASGGAWAMAMGDGVATAIVVIVAGAGLVVAAFVRGARWLVLPVIALALSSGAVAAANIDARGGVGERIYHPRTVSEVRDHYRIGVGHLRVDLRDVKFGPGEHKLRVEAGVGQAEVLVPMDLCVSTTAHVSAGSTAVYNRETGGVDHDWQEGRPAPAGKPHLTISGDVGVGQLRVEPVTTGLAGGPAGCGNG